MVGIFRLLKNIEMNLFKKKETPFHIFPNGVKVYEVPQAKHHKIPAKKILSLLEMYSYIAMIGVEPHKKKAIDDYIKDTINGYIDGNKSKSDLAEILTVINNGNIATTETMNKLHDITAMQFDCFYYLDGEDPYNAKESNLEKKVKLLKEYPLDTVFFFKNQDSIIQSYGSLLNGAIQIVALQNALVKTILGQESILTNTSTKKE